MDKKQKKIIKKFEDAILEQLEAGQAGCVDSLVTAYANYIGACQLLKMVHGNS